MFRAPRLKVTLGGGPGYGDIRESLDRDFETGT